MKTKLFFLAFLTSLLSWGQITEGFESGLSTSGYVTTATLSSGTWTGVDALLRTTNKNSGTYGCQIKATTGVMNTPSLNTCGVVKFWANKVTQVSKTIGGTTTTLTATAGSTVGAFTEYTVTVNDASTAIIISIKNTTTGVGYIDDFSSTVYSAGPAPILAITPATTNLGSSCVGTPTTAVTYTITNSGTVDAAGVTVVSSGTHNTNFVVSGLSSTTIVAGGTATYVVTFTPSATGTRNATITVASATSGSNSPSTALTGTGNASIAQAVTSGGGATAVLDVSATLNGNVTTLGVCPASIQKGFVYSETAVNNLPANAGIGVTTTSGVAVGGTGTYSEGIVGLSPNTNYTYRAYVFDGVNYTYSPIRTFTTIGVPVVSNGSFSGTSGTAITTFNLSTLSTNSPTSYAITSGVLPVGLSLNTTTGAITGMPTDTGTFTINFSATNVIGTSATSGIVTITINPTQNSDIVAVAGSSPATISSTVNTTTISTVTDGVQAWSFTIRDGGASSDADNLPTTLTALTITQGGANSISNWTHAIQSVALFDGSTFVANGTINANNIVFSGISVLAPDNGSKTLTMRLSLTCPLGTSAVDGNDFDFSITQANITFLTTGSGKNSGAPVASTPDNAVNFIEVLATSLSFTTQPSSTGVTVAMPNVVVTATDACGNRDLNFTGAVTLNSTGTITGAPLSVNAVAGVATFSNIIHSVIGTNYQMTASAVGLTNGLSNLYDIFAITQLQRGDLAIIAVNTDIGSGTDQIAFVCFEDILPGTTIFLTDNGYERQFSGLWGGTEGLVTITRTGSVLPKGTIVVFESTTANVTSPSHFDIYTCGSLDANWNKTALSGTSIGGFSLNSDDDIWIMQGGTWINDTGHQSTYNGNVLYGWSESGWNTAPGGASQDTRWSTVIDGLECYTTNVVGNAKVKFNDPINPDFSTLTNGRFDWIALINNSANWDTYISNATYIAGGYDYKGSTVCPALTVAGNTYINGKWTGKQDTNWFNCGNWDTLVVPDETVDVLVGDNTFDRQAIVDITEPFAAYYGNIAKAKNLTITGEKVEVTSNVNNKLEVHGNLLIDLPSGVLDMDDSNAGTADGQLYLFGNWTNSVGNAAFSEGNGTVYFTGTSPQIINNVTPLGTEVFYNVVLNNSFDTSVSNDLVAEGNLVINSGRVLNIDGAGYVRVNNRLTHNGDLTIQNNGQFIQVNETDTNDGVYTGTKFQVNRTAQVRNLDYVFWSSPVENFAVTSLPNAYRYYWNTLAANANGTLGNWANASGNMTKGQGYIARASNGATTAQAMNLIFSGKPNNGAFTLPIQRGIFDGADYDAEPANSNNVFTTKYDDNWNLVGNPYPSAIDAEEFLVANQTKIEGAVWVWTHGLLPTSITDPFYNNYQYNYSATDYIKYNGLGSTDPDTFAGKIASGQGFMVNMLHVASTPNTIDFNNSFRTGVGYANYNNSDFFRNASVAESFEDQEKHRVWLDVVNTTTGQSDRTLLGYASNATYGRDHFYDCIHKPNTTISFYSLIDKEPFIIQGRSLPFDVNDRVPMGLSVGATSNITIAIRKADGIFAQGQTVYLEDKQLNIIHNLSTAPYVFTSNAGIFSERFIIRYTNETLSNDDFENDSNILISSSDVITVQATNQSIQSVQIHNVLGQLLINEKEINAETFEINTLQKNKAPLLIQVTLENGKKVSKKLIF
ncbi:putative Ig domain-containing protein [Flavobacterium sasangense]|uniref:putative Ig domain-containing protein n=1 Tax=Flavobacterium sasangense TaxID=503361 RepID=UPI00047AC01E|nr:putative Ig domain-containing protein [Flavobacterium sasangense]